MTEISRHQLAGTSAPAPSGIAARARAQVAAPYLNGLNPEQRAAVETLDGPLLVLAGAGTGKTRVLTTRIAHILSLGKARPSEILAVTFTNKAAREMKTRVGAMVGQVVEGMPWLGTFHSIGVKVLRRHAELVGLKNDFTILDVDDQIRLLKQLLEAENIDEKRWPGRVLASIIDGWKNRGLTPDKVPPGEAATFANGRGIELYKAYQARLKTLNAADFGDLLIEMLRLFREHPEVLHQYHERFKYVLVDEYQDTNVAQYLWLRLIGQGSKNICCVGDDDQSIYGWRGAEVDNILRFEHDFPGATVIRLERNYRSTGHILGAASHLIAHNEGRLGKTLRTEDEPGEKVAVTGAWDSEEEARSIGEEIENLQREGHSLEEIAILVRASFQMREFEDRFVTLGLPYRVIGGPRFYERAEIRDALAYLRLVNQPADDLAFERIINTPRRGLGDATLQILHDHARFLNVPLFESAFRLSAIAEIKGDDNDRLKRGQFPKDFDPKDDIGLPGIRPIPGVGLSDRTRLLINSHMDRFQVEWTHALNDYKYGLEIKKKPREELSKLTAAFNRWRAQKDTLPHTELAEIVLDESGYTEMWQKDRSADAAGRLENLKELVRSMEEFENLAGFLEHISLVMDTDKGEGSEAVSIMTLHAAKGLEFDTVFLPGWEEGVLPHQRSLDEQGRAGLEEERRLAHVGLTRARRRAKISFVSNRRIHGSWSSAIPSRFLDELPEASVEVTEQKGGFGNYGANYGGSRFDTMQSFGSNYTTPGWQRAQARKARGFQEESDDYLQGDESVGAAASPSPKKGRVREAAKRRMPLTIEGELVAKSTGTVSPFSPGDRIFHQKFGNGNVTHIDGNKLTIQFDKAGEKRVVDSFVERV